MKKIFLILLSTVILLTSVLAGCSQAEVETGAETNVADTVSQSLTTQTASSNDESESATSGADESETATVTESKNENTESTSVKTSEGKAPSDTTTKKQTATTNKTSTTKKQSTTAKKTTTTTKKATTATTKKPTTTKKVTTTKKPTTTKKVTTTKKQTTCSNNNNHSMPVGSVGKWYNSRNDFVSAYKAVVKGWNDKWLNYEIEDDEYYANCPVGYEVWSCAYCGKWTGNYKHF